MLDDIAVQIHKAIMEGTQIEAPRKAFGIDYPAALEIRRRVVNLLGRYAGMQKGYKIAFTNPKIQELLGLTEPEYGYLFESFECPHDEVLDVTKLSEPFAEPEIAFVMGDNLVGPGITITDVLKATRYICPAIEIVNSRFGTYNATKEDMVSDNVQFARFVRSAHQFEPQKFDLSQIPVTMEVDGQVEESSTGRVMGHPAEAVAWLANKFAELGSIDIIKDGTIILSGSCTRYFAVQAGSKLTADFGPLGSIDLTFS